jgi:nucleotide-binding universal stress UspA family protein
MSTPFAHIACCLDDSAAARRALAEAAQLRGLGPGRLSAVHVAPFPPPPIQVVPGSTPPDPLALTEAAEQWLRELAGAIAPDAEPVLLTDEDPAAAVSEWAAEAGVDLLVVASHRNAAERALLGSFAGHLAHHAPCDVYLVRPEPKP